MNTILSEDYKLDKLIKLTNSLMETVINIENGVKSKQYCKSTKDSLFEEFAARGILSSLKLVERKVDQLLSTRQSDATKTANEDPVVKYSMPKSMETLINDIASKVDIIFDSVSKANEIDYSDEYLDVKDVEGSGASTDHIQKLPHHKQSNHLPQTNGICKSIDQSIKDVSDKISNIDINVLSLLRYNQQRSPTDSSSNTISTKDLKNILNKFSNTVSINQTQYLNRILNSYFHEDRTHWTSIFNSLSKKCLSTQKFPSSTVRSKPAVESTTPFSDITSLTENVYTTSNYQYDTKTEHFLNGEFLSFYFNPHI